MITFLRIPDKIQQLSEGEIQRYFIQPLIPSIFLLLAMVLIWFGGWEFEISGGESFVMTVIGILIIVICIIELLHRRSIFFVKNSMTRIKPMKIHLDSSSYQEVVDLIAQDELNEVLKFKTDKNTPLSLEIWYNDKHDKVYSQLLFYQDAAMRPISLVHVTKLMNLNRTLLD